MAVVKVLQGEVLLERCDWEMANKNTYQLKGSAELLRQELNDIPPEQYFDVFPYGPKIDVLARIKAQKTGSIQVCTLDPPFSPRQAKEEYHLDMDAVELTQLISQVKDEMARIIKPGGKAICFGWNSNGLGKGRGFKLIRQRNIPHGGSHIDTTITVELKINGSLI